MEQAETRRAANKALQRGSMSRRTRRSVRASRQSTSVELEGGSLAWRVSLHSGALCTLGQTFPSAFAISLLGLCTDTVRVGVCVTDVTRNEN
jgi:hypothetical protein